MKHKSIKNLFVDNVLATIKASRNEPKRVLRERISSLADRFLDIDATSSLHEVSILLSDIRGFSALSERYKAQEIVSTLNNYFSHMNEIIFRHEGVIDKYMGDAILVLFGVPENRPDDALRAVSCAIDMQIEMDQVNEENMAQGLPKLYIGIGINTDTVSAGQVGSELHHEYTVIGDGVNLASRVESHTLRGQILISQVTYEKVRNNVEVVSVNKLQVKGKKEQVSIYEVEAISVDRELRVPQREIRKNIRVEIDTGFSFQLIKGKEVLPEVLSGQIKNMSYNGFFVIIKQEIEPYTDIKISLSLSLLGGEKRDIYAKVMSVRKLPEGYGCGVEFTSLDEECEQSIKVFIDKIIEGQ